MIHFLEKDGVLTFKVQVVPRASHTGIVGEHNGALRVRIAAPPVDGAANEELISVLAKALSVSRSAVQITSGLSSKLKRVSVTGAACDDLATLGSVKQKQSWERDWYRTEER